MFLCIFLVNFYEFVGWPFANRYVFVYIFVFVVNISYCILFFYILVQYNT